MTPPIRALLFDFDGLIVDTEGPAYTAWRDIYSELGADLPLSTWAQVIGTLGHPFDPIVHLSKLTGRPLDGAALRERHRHREQELMADAAMREGVADYLAQATRRGLRTAIVSSNHRRSVRAHLDRLGIDHPWEAIVCADGVIARAKPAPFLYEQALAKLGLSPEEAIAFEDSPNGVSAAKGARLFCVAVPNPITATLDLSAADLLLDSMRAFPLAQLLDAVAGARGRRPPQRP